jgi:hypothetical protein
MIIDSFLILFTSDAVLYCVVHLLFSEKLLYPFCYISITYYTLVHI